LASYGADGSEFIYGYTSNYGIYGGAGNDTLIGYIGNYCINYDQHGGVSNGERGYLQLG
jgi:hypothetical protein